VADPFPPPWLREAGDNLSYLVMTILGAVGGWVAKLRHSAGQPVPSIAPPIPGRDQVAAQIEELHKAVLQPHPEFERNMPEQVRQVLRYLSFVDRYGNRVSLLGQVLETLTQAVSRQAETAQTQTLILQRLEVLMEEKLDEEQAPRRAKESNHGGS
jgi:hypothetical protein